MPYSIERFGTVILPTLSTLADIGTGPSRAILIELPSGGWFDGYGDQQAPRGNHRISKRGEILDTDAEALLDAYNALMALRGKRAKLYRRALATDEVHWTYARFDETSATMRPGEVTHRPVNLQFTRISPIWYGQRYGSWTFDSGVDFDDGYFFDEASNTVTLNTSPKTVPTPNAGNAVVTNAIITIVAGSSALTSLTINLVNALGTMALVFNGTVTSGQSLVIDCGAKSVLNNGSNAYNNLTLGGAHNIGPWLALYPGANDISVVKTGGSTNSTITISYSDGWE